MRRRARKRRLVGAGPVPGPRMAMSKILADSGFRMAMMILAEEGPGITLVILTVNGIAMRTAASPLPKMRIPSIRSFVGWFLIARTPPDLSVETEAKELITWNDDDKKSGGRGYIKEPVDASERQADGVGHTGI